MKSILMAIMMAMVLGGCASTVKKEIEMDKSHVSGVSHREEMIAKTRDILDQTPNLTEKQKDRFIALHQGVSEKAIKYAQEIRKLKVVLFNELTAKKYQPRKINELGRQIRKLSNKRLDLMFDALSKAQKILGKEAKMIYEEEWFRTHYRF